MPTIFPDFKIKVAKQTERKKLASEEMLKEYPLFSIYASCGLSSSYGGILHLEEGYQHSK
jgi:hypothetical protein